MNFQSFEDIFRKDSFDERICDDLSEDILQFLPLKDKFRLECVSKRFQRTVFQKQYQLFVSQIIDNSMTEELKLNRLKGILQKLPNIRFLKRSDFHSLDSFNDKEMDIIIENYKLVEIECNLKIMDTIRDKFVDIFGAQLIAFTGNTSFFEIIQNFPKLRELHFRTIDWSFGSFVWLSKIKSKNLKKLTLPLLILIPSDEDLQSFQTLIQNNRQLTHLTIGFYVMEETDFQFIFKQISNLKDLIELRIRDVFGISANVLIKSLHQLINKCLKFKSLSIGYTKVSNQTKLSEILNTLKRFNNFKRLDIGFQFFRFANEDKDSDHSFASHFKELKSLTHLSLRFLISDYIEVLKDIDIYLPNLQSLVIKHSIKVSEDNLKSLSGLSKLKYLSLSVDETHPMYGLFKSNNFQNIQFFALNLREDNSVYEFGQHLEEDRDQDFDNIFIEFN